MNPPVATSSGQAPIEMILPIEGMTCASCVNRIERFLARTDGVLGANVNLATERASVILDPGRTDRRRLVAAVEAAGYDVRPETAATAVLEVDPAGPARDRERRRLLIQAIASIAVAIAVMVVMWWPQTAVPMTTLNWLALVPATLIQAWAGRRFYAAAFRAARHGTTTMDTLVAVGTSAAWTYSVIVTLFPSQVEQAGLQPVTYFDSATIIIGLVLLGRWLEARARDETGGAIRTLIGLQPRTARRLDNGARARRTPGRRPGRRPASGPAGRQGPSRWGRRRRPDQCRRIDAHRRAAASRQVHWGRALRGHGQRLGQRGHAGDPSGPGHGARLDR